MTQKVTRNSMPTSAHNEYLQTKYSVISLQELVNEM